MKTRLGLHLFLLIVCGSTITAMDQPTNQKEKSHQPRHNKLFTFTSNLDAALQKRLNSMEADTVIHCYQSEDTPYVLTKKAIEKISPENVSPTKPYILLCNDFQHPDKNWFSCIMFDIKNKQWIQDIKIRAHRDKDIEIFIPQFYSHLGGNEYYPYNFKPDMNNSLFAVINMHTLHIAPDLCSKLAQGLTARGIPVVFNIQKNLPVAFNIKKELSDLVSSDVDTFYSFTLSSLQEPESGTAKKQVDQKFTGSTIEKSQPQSHRFIPRKENKQKGTSFFSDKILLIGGFSAAFIAFLCYIHFYAK